jgi:hypothetical protein
MKMKSTSLACLILACSTPVFAGRLLINEIHRRTPATTNSMVDNDESGDDNAEFIELRGTAGEYCTDTGMLQGKPLSLIFLKTDGAGNYGRVVEDWKLVNPDSGVPLQLGSNGLILLGDKYPNPTEFPWANTRVAATNLGDPQGCKAEDLPDDEGMSALLVVNYTEPATNTPGKNPDFDVDDDGVLDWKETTTPTLKNGAIFSYTTAPWESYVSGATTADYVDSIGYAGDFSAEPRPTYASANLTPAAAVHPWNLSRYASNSTANGINGWYGGELVGTTADQTAIAISSVAGKRFNRSTSGGSATWTGNATPGAPNLSASPGAITFRITEINLNPPGSPGFSYDATGARRANDGNYEYIEIFAQNSSGIGVSASLAGHSLVLVNSTGQISEHWDLSKMATGSNGFLLLGDRYPDGYCPFLNILSPGTALGDPSAPNYPAGTQVTYTSMNQGDIGSDNGFTLVLVRNPGVFRRSAAGVESDIDTDNDGDIGPMNFSPTSANTLTEALGSTSSTLPGAIIDYVGSAEVNDPGNGGDGTLVPGRDGYAESSTVNANCNLVVGGRYYPPSNFSRKMTSATALNIDAANTNWTWGVLGGRSESSLAYRTGYHRDAGLRTQATPGRLNFFTAPTAPAAGSLLINEVHTRGKEYVEVVSTAPFQTMVNTWLVVATAGTNERGTIRKVFDLRNSNTGANRLAVFGDGIEEEQDAWVDGGFISRQTFRDDPESFATNGVQNTGGELDFTPNSLEDDGVALFLVVNATQPALGDLDPNDDGVFTAPWTTTLDAISTGTPLGAALTAGSHTLAPTQAQNVSRIPGNVQASAAAAWFGGELATGATATTIAFGAQTFGQAGAASPGRANPTGVLIAGQKLLLNEIHINPPGGDNNKEFIELRSTNDAAMSMNGHSLLFIDNNGDDTGTVQKIIELDGLSTGSNGVALLGANYNRNDPVTIPWLSPNAPVAATTIYAPTNLAEDDIGRFSDNGAFCLVLAYNFKGRLGDDLDIGSDANHNAPVDDHVFDTPLSWASIADGVAIRAFAPAEPASGNTPAKPARVEGFSFPGVTDLTQANLASVPVVAYTPDTVARFRNNNTSVADAWYGGDVSGTSGTSVIYDTFQRFPADNSDIKVTPGGLNIETVGDFDDRDQDGIPYIMELALGSNPLVNDAPRLPQPAYGVVAGWTQPQPSFSFSRPVGGTPGITYTIQASFDLIDWDVPVTNNATAPDGALERKTYVLPSAFRPLLATNRRLFFRLKVSR